MQLFSLKSSQIYNLTLIYDLLNLSSLEKNESRLKFKIITQNIQFSASANGNLGNMAILEKWHSWKSINLGNPIQKVKVGWF